ncbi:hypothetical protein QL285_053461 [Trifolium repens]|nr:hypothetical protein QL285_053461 [Trifolium repens]
MADTQEAVDLNAQEGEEVVDLTLETMPVLPLILKLLPPYDRLKKLISKDIWRPSPELPLALLDLTKCFKPPKKESSECFQRILLCFFSKESHLQRIYA